MRESDHCPPVETLAAYVSGELPSSLEHGFEAHLADCSACAQRLQEEARLDVLLHAAADQLAPTRTRSWTRRWTNATMHGVGALAAAASVLLTLGVSSPWLHDEGSVRTPSARPSDARGTTDGDLLSCVPALDENDCEEPALVAQREPNHRVPWTELPEPIDPATCWTEEDGADLVCTSADALSG